VLLGQRAWPVRVPEGTRSEGNKDYGTYRIFVFADAVEINVAEFVGSDGNGYYGTGFTLTVVRGHSVQEDG
jgi:hypothetical protein